MIQKKKDEGGRGGREGKRRGREKMEEAQALVHLGVGGGWTRSEPTWAPQQATGGGAGLLFSLGQHLSVLQHKQRNWV